VAAALPDPKPTSDVSATAPAEQNPVPKNVPSDVTASITPQHTIARTAVPQPSSKSADSGGVWSETLPTAIATKSILAGIAERNPAAAYEVAMRYLEGRGVTNDSATGAIWLARAAEGGITPAQFRLGSMYEKGVGVKRNLMEARRLYIAAAAKGHATAMHNAAVLYAEGIDGRPDHAAAAEWFQKAAEYGVTDSQYNLAVLYARGLGVERNFAESYKWFAIAAEKGDKDAARKRDGLAAQLDSQTLAAAKRAANAFTPKPQPESATAVSRPAGGWEDSGLGRFTPHPRSQGQQARLSAQPLGD
jgi:localization factor PodJL